MTLEEKLILFKEKGYTYDPKTGIVTTNKGKDIKSINNGYYRFNTKINNISINLKVCQFAWYIIYNEVPNVVDHLDRNKLNDKINNLRSINIQKNSFNRDVKGYSWNKKMCKYKSTIALNNKSIHLGYYKTSEEAHQAYLDAKKIYHII